MMYGWDQCGMLGGGIIWILLLILIGLAIYFIAGRPEQSGLETPLEILKKRHAKGEIGKEQFAQMKKELGQERGLPDGL